MSVLRVVLLVVVLVAATCEPMAVAPDAGQQRPERPPMFTSPEELRNYLTQLSDFYASLGRPSRFGKRGSAAAVAAPVPGFRSAVRLAAPPDAYDQLFQYDE